VKHDPPPPKAADPPHGDGSLAIGGLTRLALENNALRLSVERGPLGQLLLSEEELEASLQSALASPHRQADVWLFGYGSLIWNPVLSYAERQPVTVHGYHRSFCLWSRINRGTVDSPGLVLGLERGGRCTGVAYRLPQREAEIDLRLLWRREMLLGSYQPRWVQASGPDGKFRALAFVVDVRRSGYTGKLSDQTVIERLVAGCGKLGTGVDYLRQTIAGLAQGGIRDPYLARLDALLRARGL
jgi:cation transport protein ChaC